MNAGTLTYPSNGVIGVNGVTTPFSDVTPSQKGVTGTLPGRYGTPDQLNGAAIIAKVENFCRRFIAYPDEDCPPVHALWIAHCWLCHVLESTPRLAVISPEKRSGKTRLQEVTALLVPNPINTVDCSAAYLFRKLDVEDGERLPTILLDEADALFFGKKTEANEDIRRILNAGYQKGKTVGRCTVKKDKDPEPRDFAAFAPACIAGIGDLPDTVMDRSIIFRMKRRAPGVELDSFRHRFAKADAEPIRYELDLWSAEVAERIRNYGPTDYPTLPACITDRDYDVWEPLFIVAQEAGGAWPQRLAEIAPRMINAAHEEPQSLGERLLMDIRTIFDEDGASVEFRLPLIAKLKALDGAPWSTLGKDNKGIDSNYLTRTLKRYEVPKAHTVVIAGKRDWGYTRADFEDAWARYLPADLSEGNASVEEVTPW